jgi:signal transduction histidine kinase
MLLRDWQVIVACGIGLALALLMIWRGRRSPLAPPLALLLLDLTTWNFADDAWHASGETVVAWHFLDHTLSPLTIPLALGFALVFVGRLTRLRWLLVVSWVLALLAAAPSLFALIGEFGVLARWGRRFTDSRLWYDLNLGHLVLMSSVGLWLLVRHAIRAGPEERGRAWGVLVAFAVLVALGFTGFLPGPGFGLSGFVVFMVILSAVVLRPGFSEFAIPRALIPVAALAASLGVIAWLLVARRSDGLAVVLLVLTVAALVTLVLGLSLNAKRSEARQRLEQLALLGHFSDQLAHNLKNPIAALKGAAEFLQVELNRGQSIAEQARVVGLLLTQVERLEKVVGDYRKLGTTQPANQELDLNSVVSSVLALQPFVGGERVRIDSELDDALPFIIGDPELLRETLENLLRNAAEALPQGGNIMVRTGWWDESHVFLSVQDDGVGMDARTRDRLRSFYTTKPGGSGLGLAFARRVAETHGGDLRIKSRPGKGTIVTVALAAH